MPEIDPDILKACPLFVGVDEEPLRAFVRRCELRETAAGEQIFRPTQQAECFFVILSGQVKVYKLSSRGDEQILHLYDAGSSFAEAAVLACIKYPAFAEAVEPTRLLVICRDDLRAAIAESPDLGLGMMAGLSEKLREFASLIEDLSLREVPARLARVLLAECRRAGANPFHLRQTKRQLAAQIGTVAETLSRALGKLRKQGLVVTKGNRIEILDPDALEDVAEG
ncbi:MAG: Crp/Fnr family transcriptional regulator [Phycisphaerae bacterium]